MEQQRAGQIFDPELGEVVKSSSLAPATRQLTRRPLKLLLLFPSRSFLKGQTQVAVSFAECPFCALLRGALQRFSSWLWMHKAALQVLACIRSLCRCWMLFAATNYTHPGVRALCLCIRHACRAAGTPYAALHVETGYARTTEYDNRMQSTYAHAQTNCLVWVDYCRHLP